MVDKAEFRHIVRIANTDVDGNKPLYLAIQKIKGVGENFARAVCSVAQLDFMKKAGNIDEATALKIEKIILDPKAAGFPDRFLNRIGDYETGVTTHLIMNDLDFTKDQDIKRQKKIKSNVGLRHQWRLPVRGQRTGSNFRPNKGKGGAVKKKTSIRK